MVTDPWEIDIDAYEAAGVARVERSRAAVDEECCEHGCMCFDEEDEEGADIGGWHLNSDDCDHCPACCCCLPCAYARHA